VLESKSAELLNHRALFHVKHVHHDESWADALSSAHLTKPIGAEHKDIAIQPEDNDATDATARMLVLLEPSWWHSFAGPRRFADDRVERFAGGESLGT
jgi:hypothetical protein